MRRPHVIRLCGDELTPLVRAAQRDEPRAVDRLLAAIRPPLVQYFSRRVPDDTADDLTQVALIRVARALPRIEPERAGSFVATIAQNLLRTAFRRRARDGRRFAANVEPDEFESSDTTDGEVELQDQVAAVRRASAKVLPRELREIVFGLLRGQSHAEIAAKQGVSRVTVRTRLLRARMILRQELLHRGPAVECRRLPSSDTGNRAA